MPGAVTPYPSLPAALLQEAIQATPLASPDDLVKTYLLNVTSELLALEVSTTSLGASSADPFSPSLQVLHARLQDGHHSPFPGLENRSVEAFARMGKAHSVAVSAVNRPLGDFEDMYYAILATVKESHESVILRLNNGFVDPDALLFPSSQYTIHLFHEWLAHQWIILNEPSLVLALDIAVRKALVDGHLCQGLRSQVDSGQITHVEAEAARAHLYQSDVFADMPGLSWVGNEHSAMINGRLNEKYRVVFQAEKYAQEKKTRWAKKQDRMKKTAKVDAKADGGRGSGHYRQRQRRVTAEQAQQAVDVFSVMTETQTLRSGGAPAERGHDQAHPSQQANQTAHSDGSFFQDEVEAWRLHTHQQMSSQRETQMQRHEHELRWKTPPAAVEQALQALPDSLRGGAVSHTPQRQTHARPVTQPHAAHVQQDYSDTGPTDQEHNLAEASPREMRAQRVTEYQAWLRESASDHARRRMRQRGQAQSPDVGDVSQQAFNGADAPMDMDGDGGC